MAFIGENTTQRLALVPNVDLKAVGQTTLFSVPSGKSCLLTEVAIEITAAGGFTLAAAVRIGKSPLFVEWLPITTLTGLDSLGEFVRLSSASPLMVHQTFAGGDAVKLDVTTGATATTLTATVHVFGYVY